MHDVDKLDNKELKSTRIKVFLLSFYVLVSYYKYTFIFLHVSVHTYIYITLLKYDYIHINTIIINIVSIESIYIFKLLLFTYKQLSIK